MTEQNAEMAEIKDDVKAEAKDDVKAEAKDDVKAEAKDDVKAEAKDDFDDIFVTESDTFDIGIKYYKKHGQVIVEEVDDAFDTKEKAKKLIVTFKYPDQSDSGVIGLQAARVSTNIDDIDVRDFLTLEFNRVTCLIRKWSLNSEVSVKNIMRLHPKIVKSMIVEVRKKIGMDAII